MTRNILSRLGAAALACLLAAQLCLCANADAENTIYISDTDELIALAEHCSYDAWSKDKTVVLQRDIDLGGVAFRPIPSFGGVFNGDGHTISGLSVSSAVSPAGLFGTVTAGGTVRALNVEGSVAPSGSGDAVGGVAGVNYGVIENCSFTGTVEGARSTGGVVGVNASGGAIRNSRADGGVFGKNMTGGIVGENHGDVLGCANRAYVNTNTLDPSLSLDRLDLSLTGALDTLRSPDTYNATVDSGGIAGFSDGAILSCRNHGSVGYQHIGYNVGGVAGRSSGHIATSSNAAQIYGRREVGGIVGMAEPHVTIDLTESSLASVRRSLNALSATLDRTVSDAGDVSDILSAHLSAVSAGVTEAEDSAQALTDAISSAVGDTVREIDRGSAILDNTLDQLEAVTQTLITVSKTATDALSALEDAADDLNGGANGGAFGELEQASNDLDAAAAQLSRSAEALHTAIEALRTALFNGATDAADIDAAIRQITDACHSAKPVLDKLSSALSHLADAASSMGDAFGHLEDTVSLLERASRQLTDALTDTDTLLAYLNAQERLQFHAPDTQTESDALYDAMRGISDNLDALNRESKASSDVVLEDLRLINRQFTALMNTLLDTVEDAEGYQPSSVIEDTSDEDIDAVIAGKVLLCSNSGAVSGDIDVGGIAGSMLIYNALDPEQDLGSASAVLRRRYELKCVLQGCNNAGDVSAKRENAGAVCGSETLGVIRACVGGGSVASESGTCVGGIAGYGDSILRHCWAKCSLSGTQYVGGIVGSGQADGGLRVEDCRSLVEITQSTQFAGAISGGTEGVFTGNRFVSDTLAGIDRVSYAGKAEPVDYETLVAEADVPAALRSFTLRFLAGDTAVKTLFFRYGDSFDASVFPEIPAVAGSYARWDRDTLENLRFDTTVRAVYTPQLTALGCDFTRSASRPAFFVEGAFDDTAAFSAEPAIFEFDAGSEGAWQVLRSWRRSVLEQWQLDLPDDGTHTLRYLPPEGVSGALTLYLRGADGSWTAVEHESMGSYLTFPVTGGSVALSVLSASTPWWLWTLLAVFLLGAALLVVELVLHKRPKATRSEAAKDPAVRRRHRRLRAALIAGVAVLGLAVGAAVKLAPRISESMSLYRLVRNYAERSELDMALSLSAELGGEPLDVDLSLYLTQCEGKKVSCAQWEDVPFWFCDGALLLENGKAYRPDGVMADYSQLLSNAAALYRAVDVSMQEENGVKTYHASAEGEDARRVLSTLLPASAELLPESERADFDLVVADGELSSLRVLWSSGEKQIHAELKLLDSKDSHTLPSAVRAAVAAGLDDAPEIGDDLARLLLAWTEAASRETLTANVALRADCGPLLLDEALVWQRSRAYSDTLNCLSRRGSTVYYTDTAICTGGGLAISRTDTAYTDTSALLRLAFKALLLGETASTDVPGGQRCTVELDADAMDALVALIAPDARALGLVPTGGTARLDLRDGKLSALSLRVAGSVRVVRADVPASVTAQLDFDPDASFRTPSDAVLAALALTKDVK
ncbi:MAG: hypothetical protein K6G54_08285 [Oscillospiraceae bacterium]|nr:hypothetical protein [Oscillospiraceae bacterium]